MRNFLRPVLFIATVLIASTWSNANAQSADDVFYPGQLWVQMNPEHTKAISSERRKVDFESFVNLIGREAMEELGLTKVEKPFHFARTNDIKEVYQLFFEQEGNETELARVLESYEMVNYAERVPVMRPTFTPNDLGPQTGNGNQWGLWRINAQDAWDISTGSTEIRVAIVDDAVLTTHPDLIPNLVPGYDVASDNPNPMPNDPGMTHGTHVAGIVGAATNNGIGVASIGFNIKIIPVKSSNSPQFISDAYAGVIWAADNGADVINMSWGGSGFSNTGQNIINYAFNAGCINIAASGNDNVTTVFYPAGYNNVVSVSSTTTNDAKSNFSNYGNWIDVSAPGSQILSTYFNNNYQGTYANLSGTSMASPMVAGLAGLVLSVNPELPQAQVVDCILSTADNIDNVNGSFINQLGSGRINAHEALLCAQATVNAPPVAVIGSDNSVVCPGGIIQFYGSSGGGLATQYEWTFPGGNPANSTSQNPLVAYAGVGTYPVTLTVTNDFGDNTVTQQGFIEVSTNGTDIFFSEDFENGTLASMGWLVENPDNDITWDISTVGGSVAGNKAAGINIFNYNAPGERDGLTTPALDFSNHYNIQLDFQHAHRRFSANFADSLIVYVSTDGGASFPNRIFGVAENGQGTFATGTILNQNFVPANGNDWCFGGDLGSACFTLDLSDFDGESDVRIKFESYNDYGNNIYVDNIELSGNCLLVQAAPQANFMGLITTICAGESIQFVDQSANVPTTYEWIFEGGTPETSSSAAPMVTYNEVGTYNVSLTVTNAFGTDEIMIENYVTVNDAPVLSLNDTEFTVCQGESITLLASGAAEYAWMPTVGLSDPNGAITDASPQTSISYTLTASAGGCVVQETVDVEVLPVPAEPELVTDNDVAFAVLETPGVSGHYPFVPPGAGWGTPNLNTVSVESQLVIARDNSAADSLLCGAPVNGAAINGNIAVIYRGGCEFGTKALAAQNAGAVGVIIVNNVPNELMEMGGGASGPNVTIPTIMVTAETGAALNAEINAGNATAVMGQFNGGQLIICPGETIRLAAPGGWGQYEWNNGHDAAVIEINSPGPYSVNVFGENGCANNSISVSVGLYGVTQPIIEPDGTDGLIVNNVNAQSFQWFYNGEPIPGATGNNIIIIGSGVYTVEIVSNNGCEAVSDPYEVVPVSVAAINEGDIKVYPVPSRDRVTIEWPRDVRILQAVAFSADGRQMNAHLPLSEIGNRLDLDISGWASGTYFIQLTDEDSTYQARIIKAN